MDVIQTGTNIATVKISELPKSTETNGRATLATNEQTNQSEALELTAVADATQTALDAAQTADQSSQTALASAATANQAAQNADTARENIAGDLAQKSSMFTGAIMGEGYFGQNSPAWLESETKTYRVVFKTGVELQEYGGVLDTANSSHGARIMIGIGHVRIVYNGYNFFDVPAKPDYLYEVIIVDTPTDCYAWCNTRKSHILQRAETYLAPKRFWLGCMASASNTLKGNIISAQVFNFAFTDEEAAASWNNGHPELWRAPDAWRRVPALTWPSSTQTPESGTWVANSSIVQREDNLPVTNGFSGNFQRFTNTDESGAPSVYLITRNSNVSPMVVEFEYRANGGVIAYDGFSGYSGFKTFPAADTAQKAIVYSHAGYVLCLRGIGSTNLQLEIRTLSIKTCECVCDLIPASLTPTVWKDISGQGNDIPYVPFDSNPAECEMAYENMGFPDTIIGTEAPAVIPNFIGQRYVDTTNKVVYTAYGTSSASGWK